MNFHGCCCCFSWILFLVSLIFLLYFFVKFSSPTRKERSETEGYFLTPSTNSSASPADKNASKKKSKISPFAIHPEDNNLVDLSFVIPAYNEEKRLPLMTEQLFSYMQNRSKASVPKKPASSKPFKYEVILVDDGSKDKTLDFALSLSEKYGPEIVKILKLDQNGGKGRAVRLGLLSARGKRVLMVDA
eukprot:Sdes_comp10702_c0_seq1m2387